MSTFIVGDVLADKYEIKAILGAGGMGTVYRARQIDLGRDVAIKIPNPQALEVPGFLTRFSREAKLVARMMHDNIVQVYEYHEGDDGVYIVMEFVEGHDMKHMLMKPPSDLKVRDVATILRASCEGLGHAHEYGIIHRDIKPHNIMVQSIGRSRWRVKIMDFGIAHLDANTNLTLQNEQLTVTGQAIGTPTYMSPEQIRGTGVTPQSDIYSFGCVMFFAFTRQTPFSGSGFTVAASHLSDPPPPIRLRVPELPEAVESIISRCLSKHPEERPADASTLGDEIFAALEPIFDIRMADIWPRPQDSAAGTDVLKPTRSLPDDAPVPTIQETLPTSQTEVDKKTVSGEFDATIAAKKNAFAGEKALADQAIRGIVHEADSPTATAGSQVTDKTIPYAGPVPAPAFSKPPVPLDETEVPRSKMMFVGVAVVALLLLAGVGAGFLMKSKSTPPADPPVILVDASSGPSLDAGHPSAVIDTPIEQPGTDSGQSQLVIEPTPAPVQQVATPTSSPVPSPSSTPEPVINETERKLELARGSFQRGTSTPARIRVWAETMKDPFTADSKPLQEYTTEMALSIAKNPEMSAPLGGGTFTIGSGPRDGHEEERPQHNVYLSPYKIGIYEVTALEFATFLNTLKPEEAKKLYKAGRGANVQLDKEAGRYRPEAEKALHPANHVSWFAAVAYTDWLSVQTGKPYRLPTESEWENAATGQKGGTGSTYPWGDAQPDSSYAQFNVTGTAAEDEKQQGDNPDFKLRHFAGNVAEWCLDWYDENAYKNLQSGARDPRGPASPPKDEAVQRRVVRGGSFLSLGADSLRISARDRREPSDQEQDVGFRLALELR